jgi:hypothetical protein
MKIESGSSSYWAQSSKNRTESTDVLAALAPITGENRVTEKGQPDSLDGDLDFSHMTRKELFDWMNNQIRSGEMSLDESSPFLAMTLKVKPSGEPVDMNTDPTKLDFVDIAKRGVDTAESRGEFAVADRWRTAWNSLQQLQGTLPSLNFFA